MNSQDVGVNLPMHRVVGKSRGNQHGNQHLVMKDKVQRMKRSMVTQWLWTVQNGTMGGRVPCVLCSTGTTLLLCASMLHS